MTKSNGDKKKDSRKALRAMRRKAGRELRLRQRREGLIPQKRATLPSRQSRYTSEEEEKKDRGLWVERQMDILRGQIPLLLEKLKSIPDPRNPEKLKHKLTVIFLTGMLLFLFHEKSRREANREFSRPVMKGYLQELIPGLESLPHQDTVEKVLSLIGPEGIEQTHLGLMKRFLKQKKFIKYLLDGHYPLAMDGTQKLGSYDAKSDEYQHRSVGQGDEKELYYYVYTVEVSFCFRNGMRLPLMTEFLSLPDGDVTKAKQDCELKAFYRLAGRLKKEFPRLPFMFLLDGLYANGPVMECCINNDWDFMIVLKEDCLKSVWEEYESLLPLEGDKNRRKNNWKDRKQTFTWVNEIQYTYGPGSKKSVQVHVVVCEEEWEVIDPEPAQPKTCHSRWAWLSGVPLTQRNVVARCNQGGRMRWRLETGFLVAKHQGYQYEHCIAYNWNSMRAYHQLMRIAELLNELVLFSTSMAEVVKELGKRPLIKFLKETLMAPWLSHETTKAWMRKPPQQLRLI